MRQMGRLLALLVMAAGTVALALLAHRLFGLPGVLIAVGLGFLITVRTLRL